MIMAAKQVVIIGGGLAGISAAVAALEKGWQPVVLEKSNALGGRARSLYAKDVNHIVDNGQHVLSANYQYTRWLLNALNTRDKVHFQKRLKIDFFLSHHRQIRFQVWNLPSPLHFMLPLLLRFPLSSSDRTALFRWAWMSRTIREEQLRSLTVQLWLDLAGKSPVLQQVLWTPLTLATLNTPIEHASAFLLNQVLKYAFLAKASQSGLGVPDDMLSEIFAKPAHHHIEKEGGSVFTGKGVSHFNIEDNRVTGVITQHGETIPVRHVVLAIPPASVRRIVEKSLSMEKEWVAPFHRFQYAPIITINIWLRKPLPFSFPVALVNSPLQWLFAIPRQGNEGEGYGYTGVISAAHREVSWTREELLRMMEREFHRFFRISLYKDMELMESKIIKEKFATILQTPESLTFRPEAETPYSNLFLAGDWVNTGLPATIESAVLSGKEAIEKLSKLSGQ